ncbi:21538_t:CDS:2, partial [Dentiscutata erythropus]
CAKAIKLNPKNIKAYYRSAKALYELDKINEAIDCCDHGIKLRNIKMEITNNIDNNNSSVHLNSENQLIWPVIFLYPEYKQSDFITEFNEENTFQDHLEIMFGEENSAPWDISKKYINIDKLEIYYEYNLTEKGGTPRLLKIKKNCNLRKVLSHPKYLVKNGIPSFFILSDLSGEFKNKFLANYK